MSLEMSLAVSVPYCPPCSSAIDSRDSAFPPLPVELVQRSSAFVKKKWRAGRPARLAQAQARGVFQSDFDSAEGLTEDARVDLPPPDQHFCGIATGGTGQVLLLCSQDYSYLRDYDRSRGLLHGPFLECEIAETAEEGKLRSLSLQRRDMFDIHQNRSHKDKRVAVKSPGATGAPFTSPVKKRLPPPPSDQSGASGAGTQLPESLPVAAAITVPWEHIRTPVDMAVVSTSSVDDTTWGVTDDGAMYAYVSVGRVGGRDWVRMRSGHIDRDTVAGIITKRMSIATFSKVAVGHAAAIWAIGNDKHDVGRLVARTGFSTTQPQGTDWLNMGDEVMPPAAPQQPSSPTRRASRAPTSPVSPPASASTRRFIDVSVGSDGSVWAATQEALSLDETGFAVWVRDGAMGQSLGTRWLSTSPDAPLRHIRPVKIAHASFASVFALLDVLPEEESSAFHQRDSTGNHAAGELYQRCGITDTNLVGTCWRKIILDSLSVVADIRLPISLIRRDILPMSASPTPPRLSHLAVAADGSAWGIEAGGQAVHNLTVTLQRASIAPSTVMVHDTLRTLAETLYDSSLAGDLMTRSDLSPLIRSCREALLSGAGPAVSMGLSVSHLLDRAVLEAVYGPRSLPACGAATPPTVRPIFVEESVDPVAHRPSFRIRLEWELEAGSTPIELHIVTSEIDVFDVIARVWRIHNVATEVYTSARLLSQPSNVSFLTRAASPVVSRLLGTSFSEQYTAERTDLLQLRELPNEVFDVVSGVVRELVSTPSEELDMLPSSTLRRLQQLQSRTTLVTTRALLLGAARKIRIHCSTALDVPSPVVTLLCDDFGRTHTVGSLFRAVAAEYPKISEAAAAADRFLQAGFAKSWSLAVSNWKTNIMPAMTAAVGAIQTGLDGGVAELEPCISVVFRASLAALVSHGRNLQSLRSQEVAALRFITATVPNSCDSVTLSGSLESSPLELRSSEGRAVSCLPLCRSGGNADDLLGTPPIPPELELVSSRLIILSSALPGATVKTRLRFATDAANAWVRSAGQVLKLGDDYPDGVRRVTVERPSVVATQQLFVDDDLFLNTSDEEPPAPRDKLVWPAPLSERRPKNDPKLCRRYNQVRSWLALLPPSFYAEGQVDLSASEGDGLLTITGQTDIAQWEAPGGVDAAVIVFPKVDVVFNTAADLMPTVLRIYGEGSISGVLHRQLTVTYATQIEAPYFGPCTVHCDLPLTPLPQLLVPFAGPVDSISRANLFSYHFLRTILVSGQVTASCHTQAVRSAQESALCLRPSGWFPRRSLTSNSASSSSMLLVSGMHVALFPAGADDGMQLSRRKGPRRSKTSSFVFALEKAQRRRTVWTLEKRSDSQLGQAVAFPINPVIQNGDIVLLCAFGSGGSRIPSGTFRVDMLQQGGSGVAETLVVRESRFQLIDTSSKAPLSVDGVKSWSAAALSAPTPFSIIDGEAFLWGNLAKLSLRVEPSQSHCGRHAEAETCVRLLAEVADPMVFVSHAEDFGDVTLHERSDLSRGPCFVVEVVSSGSSTPIPQLQVALKNSSVAFLGSHSPVLSTTISHGSSATVADEFLSFSCCVVIQNNNGGELCSIPMVFQASLLRSSSLVDERHGDLPPTVDPNVFDHDTRFSSLQFVGRIESEACRANVEADIRAVIEQSTKALVADQAAKAAQLKFQVDALIAEAEEEEIAKSDQVKSHEAVAAEMLRVALAERDDLLSALRDVKKDIEGLETKASLKPHKEAFYRAQERQLQQRRSDILHQLASSNAIVTAQQKNLGSSFSSLCAAGMRLAAVNSSLGATERLQCFSATCQKLGDAATSSIDAEVLPWTLEELAFEGFCGPHAEHSSLLATAVIALTSSPQAEASSTMRRIRADSDGRVLWELSVPLHFLFRSERGRRAFASTETFRDTIIRPIAHNIAAAVIGAAKVSADQSVSQALSSSISTVQV
jgi:hypothetical protein